MALCPKALPPRPAVLDIGLLNENKGNADGLVNSRGIHPAVRCFCSLRSQYAGIRSRPGCVNPVYKNTYFLCIGIRLFFCYNVVEKDKK